MMNMRSKVNTVFVGVVALGLVTVMSVSAGAARPPGAGPPAPEPDPTPTSDPSDSITWTLDWSDEFNGTAGTGVNTNYWWYATGTGYDGGPENWGTNEIETMTSSTDNVYHDGNGNLAIKPIRDAAWNWTSGRIETVRDSFEPAAGGAMRVEARIQMPNVTGPKAQGYWPAFWMLGEPYRGNMWNWPSVGEIDIMENVNGKNMVWAVLHCGTSPGGPCNEPSGIGNSIECPNTTCQSTFHVYRVDWDRTGAVEEMRWYVDGVLYHTVKETQVDEKTWTDATAHGFFIILNVAIGGDWAGNPTPRTTSGVPMLVDYVRVSNGK